MMKTMSMSEWYRQKRKGECLLQKDEGRLPLTKNERKVERKVEGMVERKVEREKGMKREKRKAVQTAKIRIHNSSNMRWRFGRAGYEAVRLLPTTEGRECVRRRRRKRRKKTVEEQKKTGERMGWKSGRKRREPGLKAR